MPLTLPPRGTARAGSIAAGRSAPGFGFGTPTAPTVPPAAPPAGGDAFGIVNPGGSSPGLPFGYVGGGTAADAGEDAFYDGPGGRGNHPTAPTAPPGSPLFSNPSNGGLPFGTGPGGGNTTNPDGSPLDLGDLPQIPDPTAPVVPVTPAGLVVQDEATTDETVQTHRPDPVSSAGRTAVVLAILAAGAMILLGVMGNRRPRASRRSSSRARSSSTATRRNARARKGAR